jgi:hypothetical protein
MKKTVTFLVTILVVTFTITVIATSEFVADDKHPAHHQQGDASQKPQARVNGATNPELIPDLAAYEILFRLLSSTVPEEKKDDRKRAYLSQAGFSTPEAAAITYAAYEYSKQIEPLDAEVDEIKNKNWPSPSAQVMSQLAQLQKQKEAIIEAAAGNLQSRLNRYSPTRLRSHLEQIKRTTKGFSTALPTKNRVGRIGDLFSEMFVVSAQGAGCDTQVYIYTSVTVDWNSFMVYGNGSYSQPFNNCGHTTTLATSLSGPLSTYATGGDGASLSLQYGSSWLDGNFTSNTDGTGFCPVVYQQCPVGSAADSETVAAWVRLVSGSTSPNQIVGTQGSNAATFTVLMDVSLAAAGKTIGISPGVQLTSGNLLVSDFASTPGDGASVTISGGSFTISYTANTTERAGMFKPSVDVSTGTAEVRPGPGPANVVSSNAVTVNNPQ